MPSQPKTSFALLFLHLLIAAFSLWNLTAVPGRARVPFETFLAGDDTYVGAIDDPERSDGVQRGDRLLAWEHLGIAMPQHLELLADMSAIGDTVALTLERSGVRQTHTVELIPFYPSYRFAAVTAFTGMTILVFALFLYFKRPRDRVTLYLHWSLLSLATVTMMTQGAVESDSLLSFCRRSLLFLSYNMTPAFFFLFAVSFPRPILSKTSLKVPLILGSFVVLAAGLSWLHIDAMITGDPGTFAAFQRLYDAFHLVFLVVLALGLVFIFIGYTRERMPERRRALRWMFYGLVIGSVPFLVLVVLPQLWGPDLLVAEELATFFTLAIPLSFIVAFLRYHVFSIEIQYRRRLTTFLLHTSLSLLQLLFAAIILSIFWEDVVFGSHILEVLGFGLLLIGLIPVRSILGSILEEAIFPARFNPTRILEEASTRFQGLFVASHVGPVLAMELERLLPGFSFGWYTLVRSSLRREGGIESLLPSTLPGSPHVTEDLRAGRPVVDISSVRPHHTVTRAQQLGWLRENGISFALPVRDASDSLLGVVAGRQHVGADPIESGEFELVQTLSARAAGVIERLHLQETMILEQRKRKEFEELSALKSHFVSSVSHDLRTPLTSIGMFLEMLDQSSLKAKDRKEYLGIIQQETERLRRLVENVLDFARAERGVKEFATERCELTTVLRGAAAAMAGQFKAVGARYTVRIPSRLPRIVADPQALERAFVNLLANAYKYTGSKKRVSFTARRLNNIVRVTISDNGVGISPDQIPKVFDPFFRVREAATSSSGGVGLGLSLVKRTLDYHGGTIAVRSKKGAGTTVTVDLPVQAQRP